MSVSNGGAQPPRRTGGKKSIPADGAVMAWKCVACGALTTRPPTEGRSPLCPACLRRQQPSPAPQVITITVKLDGTSLPVILVGADDGQRAAKARRVNGTGEHQRRRSEHATARGDATVAVRSPAETAPRGTRKDAARAAQKAAAKDAAPKAQGASSAAPKAQGASSAAPGAAARGTAASALAPGAEKQVEAAARRRRCGNCDRRGHVAASCSRPRTARRAARVALVDTQAPEAQQSSAAAASETGQGQEPQGELRDAPEPPPMPEPPVPATESSSLMDVDEEEELLREQSPVRDP